MIIPKLKRIKVSSEHELRNWLAKNSEQKQEVMIVTCNKKSRDKHISGDLVRDALDENGWAAGQNYALDGNLVGHVVSYT
jgi:citrate lyase synthetase